MTGRQEHPGTGYTLRGVQTMRVDCAALARSLGIEHVVTVNPYDLLQLEKVLTEEINRPEPSVIISEAPCVLHRRDATRATKPYAVQEAACIGCKACLQLGCPAIEWQDGTPKGVARINEPLCAGCTICAQVCAKGAIQQKA
jgi:indolepyruvate ferredoxin oxidoreductase alpha subunit